MKNILLVGVLGILVVAALYALSQSRFAPGAVDPEASLTMQETEPSPNTREITTITPDDANRFTHPVLGYSFSYPNDYTLNDDDNQHPQLYKRAATQRSQSELTDGVLIVFSSMDRQGYALEKQVDDFIQGSTENGSQLIQPKQKITIGENFGYMYELSGMNAGTHYFLQDNADSQRVIWISALVVDPQQEGYQQEVEAIIASLDINSR